MPRRIKGIADQNSLETVGLLDQLKSTDQRLLRLCGGITYQPIYTFQDQIRQFADHFRSDLLRSPTSPWWPAKGFQVSIEGTKVKVRHVNHEKWFGTVSESDIYFQYDWPKESDALEMIRVQSDLFNKACNRIGIEALSSLGVKLVSIIPLSEPDVRSSTSPISRLITLDPRRSLLKDRLNSLSEMAFRLGYELSNWSAALQVSSDLDGGYFLVDLDCYCRDVFSLNNDYLQFMMEALEHFTVDVRQFLAPLQLSDGQWDKDSAASS